MEPYVSVYSPSIDYSVAVLYTNPTMIAEFKDMTRIILRKEVRSSRPVPERPVPTTGGDHQSLSNTAIAADKNEQCNPQETPKAQMAFSTMYCRVCIRVHT